MPLLILLLNSKIGKRPTCVRRSLSTFSPSFTVTEKWLLITSVLQIELFEFLRSRAEGAELVGSRARGRERE